MLPIVISREVEEGIKSFLRTTFPPSTSAFEQTLGSFLDEPGQVFKGPYYSLRLPFRPAPPQPLPFSSIERLPYDPPHLHQARALSRLCADLPRRAERSLKFAPCNPAESSAPRPTPPSTDPVEQEIIWTLLSTGATGNRLRDDMGEVRRTRLNLPSSQIQ